VEGQTHLPDTLEELRALERQAEREWWWLHGALNAVAQMLAERAGGSPVSFREMQGKRWNHPTWTGCQVRLAA
jgi:hypothetical protein